MKNEKILGKVDVLLRQDDPYKDFVLKKIAGSFNKLRKFFPIMPNLVSVFLVYSRKEFDKFVGKKTKGWQVGHANSTRGMIYVFSPLVFEKESSHKKGDFPKVLTHELAHIFIHKIYPYYEPRWLVEGLAYYLAGMKGGSKFGLSFLWVKFLVENFGKEKLFALMKKCGFPYQREKFLKVFKIVYGAEMNFLEEKFRGGGDRKCQIQKPQFL